MKLLLFGKLFCDNDELCKCYNIVLEESEVLFMVEMIGIFINIVERYMRELKVI